MRKIMEQKWYEYTSFPDNVRQIGEITGEKRIYIEDYVLTDIRRIFQEKQERAISVFLGKQGMGQAEGGLFVYGSIEVDLTEEGDLGEEQWDEIYRVIHQYFPGSKVVGWGFGVGLWNSQIDSQVRKLQEQQFGDMGQVLFLAELSEQEEKVFIYEDNAFEEMSGYFIYFAKNPYMQNYMLRDQKEESFEEGYDDEVTKSIRRVIHKKKTRQEHMQMAAWGLGAALFVLLLFAGNLLLKSMDRIRAMEEAIQTISGNYDTKILAQQDEASPSAEKTAPTQDAEPDKAQETFAQGSDADDTSGQESNVEKAPGQTPALTQTTAPDQTGTPTQIAAPTQTAGTVRTAAPTQVSGAAQAATTPVPSSQMESYVVKKGDTLSQIVWKQYHSFAYMDRVLHTNRIKNGDEIFIGQCILLPEP